MRVCRWTLEDGNSFGVGLFTAFLAFAAVVPGVHAVVAAAGGSPDGEPIIEHFVFPASERHLSAMTPTSAGWQREILAVDLVLTGQLPEGDTPSGVAFTPDGSKIVVAHRDSRNLVVFDATTRTVLSTIDLSGSPQDVAVSPDGIHVVTANLYENTASIADLSSGLEVAAVVIGDQPGVVRVTPSGATAVVANTFEGSLSVIDIASATEVRRIPGLQHVASVSVAFEPGVVTASFSAFELAGETKAVFPDYYTDRILIIDLTTGVVTPLPSTADPRAVAVAPDGITAVVSHVGTAQRISVVDVPTATITKTIALGADAWGPISVNPTATKAVVAIQNACRVVNLVTNAVSAPLNTLSVNQVLTTADGNYALTIGFAGSLIDYATETLLVNLNNVVSTAVGAVSPAGPRGAMVANLFGEDMVVVNTAGAAGFREGVVPSGPLPEGDKARTVAVTPDGTKAVVANILSDNASIIDLIDHTIDFVAPVGDRPAEVEITPNGSTAVVANLDSPFTTIVDVATGGFTNVDISRRASEVEISPDGQFAYVAVVADGDGVWRINLATASVQGAKLVTGNMGSIVYMFNQASGMTLSHDGATLVTCNSFDDTITMIDTASWSVVKTLVVGDFPVRATFSAADGEIYVSNRDSDNITVVQNAGALSVVTGTIAVGNSPFEMVISPDGGTLYVSNFADSNVGVVDLATGIQTNLVALPHNTAGLALDPTGEELYVASGTWSVSIGPGPQFSISSSGELSIVNTATLLVEDQYVGTEPPAMLVYDPTTPLAVYPSPFGDGRLVFDLEAVIGVEGPSTGNGPALWVGLPRPNPSPHAVTLEYWLAGPEPVSAEVLDVQGRRVARLTPKASRGWNAVTWDGRHAGGPDAGAGIYFMRVTTPSRSVVRRVALR